MNKEPQHNLKYLKETRKELRNNGTPAEAILWTHLKGKQLDGRKFRRQHSIDNFIVDFFCYSENLIIELDGGYHKDAVEAMNDEMREEYLTQKGFKVLRFNNQEVYSDIERVLDEIRNYFTTPAPSLQEGS